MYLHCDSFLLLFGVFINPEECKHFIFLLNAFSNGCMDGTILYIVTIKTRGNMYQRQHCLHSLIIHSLRESLLLKASAEWDWW